MKETEEWMKVTYDEQADAVICYLTDRESARTIQVSRDVLLDFDSDQNLRGISVLFASRSFPGVPFIDGLLMAEELDQDEWPVMMPMGHAG